MNPTTIIAILCITILEVCALVQGINGVIFGVVIAAISGLGGYHARKYRDRYK